MSSLDQQDLFASGPHTIMVGSPQRQLARRGFAGLDGEMILDMGLRTRQITQRGRLQAQSAASLATLIANIEAVLDGRLHDLTDNHSRQHTNVLVEEFQPGTPIQRGRGYWCEYTIRYRQMI